MTATRLRSLLGQIEQLSGGAAEWQGSDRQLLADFVARRDEAAFAELVARHGTLVMRVCRRVLRQEQDAEDAFQATFLVLARCAGSIRKREALADWLHGVAYRTAMKAKRSAARRHHHEAQIRERTQPVANPTWDDVQAVLDEEIQRLPSSFRTAFVLCVLEGKTVPAAAAEIGWKEGTMSSRLTRARQRLQARLARRGIQLAALLAALCVAEGVAQAVPGALGQMVIRNSLLAATGGTAAGAIPAHVAELASRVARTMFFQKVKVAVIVLLALGLFAAGAGALAHQLLKAEAEPSIARHTVKPPPEPTKPAEDTIEVTGRVLDPSGKPVAKARLYQPRFGDDYYRQANHDAVSLGVTDAEGRFQVKMVRRSPTALGPTYSFLLAAADGFGFNWVELPNEGPSSEVTLRLVKDQVVRGRLVNTEGKPVVGVLIDVKVVWPLPDAILNIEDYEGRRQIAPAVRTAFNKVVRVSATDKDGRLQIAGLGIERGAEVSLQNDTVALPDTLIATREGFDPKPLLAKYRKNDIASCDIVGPSFECVVLPTRAMEGTVREVGSNKPVAGAKVVAQAGDFNSSEAVTDAKGHYRLTGLTKTKSYPVKVSPEKATALFERTVQVADRPGLETITGNVELSRGVLVTGHILDKATGKGVRSAVRWVPLPDNLFAAKDTDPDHRQFAARSDVDGRFSLVTIPGPGVIQATRDGGDFYKLEDCRVNPYKNADFDEADRKRVKVEKTPDGVRYLMGSGGGKVLIEDCNALQVLDVKDEGKPVVCDLTFDPGQKRIINLEDPDGKPLTGVLASGLSARLSASELLRTAMCPVYAFEADQPRKLAFLHRERKLAGQVTLHGNDPQPLTVRLVPTAVVSGRVLDAKGQPLADAQIQLGYPADTETIGPLYWYEDLVTDKEGRFRVEGVFPGVKFSLYAFKGLTQRDQVTGETPVHESLKAGETTDLGDIRVKARSP